MTEQLAERKRGRMAVRPIIVKTDLPLLWSSCATAIFPFVFTCHEIEQLPPFEYLDVITGALRQYQAQKTALGEFLQIVSALSVALIVAFVAAHCGRG